ncbi:MAG: hypothetical protein K1X72_00955 [Pyrinomonadaceae bacterium]|nr:hypothetical protein [Pyrinomonadaceae bacterium]
MREQLIDSNDAKNDLLACATFLAQKIGSSDGHAEAVKELFPFYLVKDNVDLAAELADTIDDPFVRDQLLTQVVEKCAQLGDDEYALQLAEAIEDSSFQGVALEQIARQKAMKGEFEKAFEIADDLQHASSAYAGIALCQGKEEAMRTIEKIDFPTVKVHVLQEVAVISNDVSLLERATEIAQEIDFDEERIRAYLGISFQYIEAKRKDKAIEVLDKARQFSETLDSVQKDSFLSQISNGFMKAGSIDLADRTLDLVEDKYEIAHALVGYADEYQTKGEEEEALEALDEAYQILKSQRDTETRNTKAKFNLLGIIAMRYASFGKLERAIEIANENPYDEIRDNTLVQLAVTCEQELSPELADQAINDINDKAEKALAMIAVSDVRRKNEKKNEAMIELNNAYSQIANIEQLSMKSYILNTLADRFNLLGETDKAREICSENLQLISQILDQSHRVSSMAGLANMFESLNFELNDSDKLILETMVRKASW